jgi:phage terminase large subunit
LIALGRKPQLIPEHKIEDGINAAHMMFKRVWFDEAKCAPRLEALRQYRVDYDEKLRAFKKTPKEDWTCDTADAFRYVAMAWKEIAQIPAPVTPPLFKPASKCTYLEWSTEFGRPRAQERA